MKKIIIALSSALLFASCTKVIKLDLNSADPKVVIEGTITNDTLENQIKISKTVNFSESNVFPAVTNATVVLTDNAGNSETLTSNAEGIYKINSIVGTPGRTYNLSVTVDGKNYTSSSTMPYPTPLDSINILSFGFGGQNSIFPVPTYKDSLGVKNSYRFVLYKNSKQTEDVFVANDDLSDGKVATQPYFGDTEFKTNDTIGMEMQCIDPSVYLYFFSLDQNTNGGATPANPVSNINGGCLGYFSAQTVSRKTKVVQ